MGGKIKGTAKSDKVAFEAFPGFKNLQERVEKAKSPFDAKQHKDETRAMIAKIFTWGFFILVTVTLIGVPLYTWATGCRQDDLTIKDIMLVISGVVGGPFGFVLGHYFKSDSK